MAPLSIRVVFGLFSFLFIIFLLIILVIFNFTTILFVPCMGIFVLALPLHRGRSSVGPRRDRSSGSRRRGLP